MTVRPPSLSVTDLKKIKNTVIGNPSAKVELAQDEDFIRTLVQCLNHPPPSSDPQSSQDDIRIEVAHIIASLSYGSDRALATLLHANALGSLLLAISNFRPNEPSRLRAAFARALRALGVAIADIVGPALWGLRPDDDSEIKDRAKDALSMLFQETTLDIYAPLLAHPATATSVAYLIGMSVRSEAHRKAVVDWLPPAERAQANKSRRGWEKSTVATAASAGVASIKAAGGWVVQMVAGLLKGTRDCKLQEAALLCLAALARDNAPVAAALSRGDRECQSCPCVVDILSSLLQRRYPRSFTSQDPSSAMSRLQRRYAHPSSSVQVEPQPMPMPMGPRHITDTYLRPLPTIMPFARFSTSSSA
ncbi:uncharacterized protein SCHCODRAFT_02044636 [Schizophyllum commune H4-8]|uniref:uncharacterized protein n=1 Tax=Schizophyllum commune (strain H4-8 / FGSC 9210) TaxID=578458 RepID=UPI00215FF08A|nr:uncharacterized protein SCHCODRAFT_02044636 [Schizophyllum commune H4-8]KAI5900820.1 hypothetical protein SCHCODRAFT_02044636 [Schizophyllum commune H4-8]